MRIMLIMSIFLEIKLFLIFLILKTDSMIESALIKNTPDFGGHFFPYIYKMFGSASIVTKARVNIEFIHSASVLARGIALSDRESLGKPKLMTYSTFTLYWFLVSSVKPLFASLTTRWNSILNIQNYHEDCLYHKHHSGTSSSWSVMMESSLRWVITCIAKIHLSFQVNFEVLMADDTLI